MKRPQSILILASAISLFLGVIWLGPAFAVEAPAFSSLGQITADSLRIPGAMDLDEAGNLYVADARGGLVHKFDAYGSLLQSYDLQVSGRGLAVTPDGALLYVARQQSVVVYSLAENKVVGELSGAEVDAPEFIVAGEVDLDGEGNVFVADSGGMLVKVYDAAGAYRASFGGVGVASGQFRQIGGLSINPFGQVVVADSSSMNNKVHVFTLNPDLTVNSVVAYANNSTANFGSPTMFDPRGIAFDPQGRGYFLAFMRSQVRVVSETFGYLGVYGETGVGVGQLGQLNDAIYDAVNNRLFVGCDAGRIVILGVDGGSNPVHVNVAPAAPVAQSPIGGSEVTTAQPTLVFANATDKDGDSLTYHVTVTLDDDVIFQGETVASDGETSSVTVSGVSLLENTQYAWTVKAFDGEFFSSPEVEASFVVNAVDERPGTPKLLSPLENASVSGVDQLSWTQTDDPDPNDQVVNYLVEVAGDEGFAEVLLSQEATADVLALGDLQDYALLTDGESYFWRVTAFDNNSNASEAGTVGQFLYDTTMLTVSSNVPGTQVYVGGNHAYDGQWLGVAPLELRDVAVGTVSLVLERTGFEPYVASVAIAEDSNVSLSAVLVPAMQVDALSVKAKGINGRAGLAVNGNGAPFLVDYDSDGVLDMMVGDSMGQITLFAGMVVDGRGRLSFSPGVSLDLPSLPGAVPFVADWDNDGRKDLLVGLSDGTVKLFLNAGMEEAPVFGDGQNLNASGVQLDAGAGAAPAVADINKDGLKDLLVGNADGQVLVYLNSGSDAAPSLGKPATVFTVESSVVPMPVDWDADGTQEIMITSAGVTLVYAQQDDGTYVAAPVVLGDAQNAHFAAFPVDCDGGEGKEVVVGLHDGRLTLLSDKSKAPVGSFKAAVLEKIDELGAYVADELPEQLGEISSMVALAESDDFYAVRAAADNLATKTLPVEGLAQAAAIELADICEF